jgi:hypothetical protein
MLAEDFFLSSASLRRTWIEARQQAAEEELEMPVVLEEFGCKLDKRSAPICSQSPNYRC